MGAVAERIGRAADGLGSGGASVRAGTGGAGQWTSAVACRLHRFGAGGPGLDDERRHAGRLQRDGSEEQRGHHSSTGHRARVASPLAGQTGSKRGNSRRGCPPLPERRRQDAVVSAFAATTHSAGVEQSRSVLCPHRLRSWRGGRDAGGRRRTARAAPPARSPAGVDPEGRRLHFALPNGRVFEPTFDRILAQSPGT